MWLGTRPYGQDRDWRERSDGPHGEHRRPVDAYHLLTVLAVDGARDYIPSIRNFDPLPDAIREQASLGAEAVLTLHAVISNGDFEEYWQFHLKCEHQRPYPGIKHGQYALGA